MTTMDVSNDAGNDSSISYSNGGLAVQACASCKKQKRRCDKQMPSCGLCQRIGRTCDYSADSPGGLPTSEDFQALQRRVNELESLIAQAGSSNNSNGDHSSAVGRSSSVGDGSSNRRSPPVPDLSMWLGTSAFPAIFFLDSNMFEYERYQIQTPYVKVPPGALTPLGSSAELRAIIEQYFETVHTYFPIVSKIRLYQHLANPTHEPGADIALLFLSMKMISSEIPDGAPAISQLYQDVKSFFNYIESQNQFSVHLIQALILIALYEIGHGIYPAAYMTIGHAARTGHAMGIHVRGTPQMISRPTTWTEQEERRRIWWGVMILDRFVNIGHRGKPFATADPSLDVHLPTDDAAWDRGQMLVAAPLALSASQAISATPFARTCQSAHLLGKVIRHIDDANLPMDFRFTEALQLHRTTRTLAGLLPGEDYGANEDDDDDNNDEEDDMMDRDGPAPAPASSSTSPSHRRTTLCSSMAICYSALLTLYDAYSCTERMPDAGPESQLVMQKEAIDGLASVSAQVLQLARKVRAFIDRRRRRRGRAEGLRLVSPLIVDSFYQAAANYAWYLRESSDNSYAEHLGELKELLSVLDQRWKVAGESIKIILGV